MATHSSILAWRILWTEEPRGLWSMGSQKVKYDKQLSSRTYCFAIKWKFIFSLVFLKVIYGYNNNIIKSLKQVIFLKYIYSSVNVSVGNQSESVSHSVVPVSLWSHGLQPTRLLCPWNSPGKNTGVGSHSLLQGMFPTQAILYHLSHQLV